jgi:hypothetical protein
MKRPPKKGNKVSRSRKIGLIALCLAELAAIFLFARKRSNTRHNSIQARLAAQAADTQAQLNTLRQAHQFLLDAPRKRSTRLLVIFVNAIGLLSFAAGITFLVTLLCGVGASASAPTGLAGFIQKYASLAPACIDVGGVLLIARMARSGEKRRQQPGKREDWVPRTLASIALYVVGTLLAYQTGKLVSIWYLPFYHATTSATINADNVVQASISWLFFGTQMKLVLDPPYRLRQRLRRLVSATQEPEISSSSAQPAARGWLNAIAYLAGIVPLLVCVGVFIIPILLGVGAAGTSKGFAAFVQHQAAFGPALFGAGCTLAIALMGRYADNNWSHAQEQRPPEDATRSWAIRLLTTYTINPVGVWSSYASAKLVSRLYQQEYHHAVVTAVINVDNLWQSTYGWLFFLPIPLIQVVFPAWNAKRKVRKLT